MTTVGAEIGNSVLLRGYD